MRRDFFVPVTLTLAAAVVAFSLLLLLLEPSPAPVPAGSSAAAPSQGADREHARHAPARDIEPAPVLAPSRETGILAGRLVDGELRPLPGAGVRLEGDGPAPWIRNLRTGLDGRFDARVPAGRVRLDVLLRDLLPPPPREVWVAPGRETFVELRASPTTEARLHLLGAPGEGIPGARLALVHARTGRTFSASCGPDGTCRISNLPPGEYAVEAAAPGYVQGREGRRAIVLDRAEPDLEIPLTVSSRIGGTVRDEAGAPVSGAEIRAVVRGGRPYAARSESDGTFLLDVPPGRVLLGASHPDFAPVLLGVLEARRGGWSLLDAVLAPGVAVTGTVGNADGPLPGARVRLQRLGPGADAGFHYPAAHADAGGRFAFPHVASGEHVLAADAEGLAGRTLRLAVDAAGPALVVDVRLGAGVVLEGRVADAAGRPVAGVSILARDPRAGEIRARTGEDGAFRLEGLSGLEIALSVEGEGFAPAMLGAVDPKARPVEIELDRLGGLEGIVSFAGVGQRGVAVTASAGATSYRTRTGGGGAFVFEGLPPGTYALEASAPGFRSPGKTVTVGEGSILRDVEVLLQAED